MIVYDEIAQPLRAWVLRKWPLPSKPGKLITCYWCSGFWVSGLLVTATVVPAAALHLTPWSSCAGIPIFTLAVSYASAVLLDKEGANEA